MDILPILIIIAVGLLFYKIVIYKDPDELDKTGHPVNHRKRNSRIL